MPTTVVAAESMRRTETPNAVMTTVASPSQGPTDHLSVWKVVMAAGQVGPLHVFDREQVWHVTAGEIVVALDGDILHLAAGDAVVLPAGLERQITALTVTEILACGRGDAVASVPGEDQSRGTPPWIG